MLAMETMPGVTYFQGEKKTILFVEVTLSVMLSCVCVFKLSRVQLFATPWTADPQAPLSFPGKNTGVGCHAILQGSSRFRDPTHISCIAGRFFTTATPREATGSQHIPNSCKHVV